MSEDICISADVDMNQQHPVVLADSHAEVRPGFHIVEPETHDDELIRIQDQSLDVDNLIRAGLHLERVARNFRTDPAWPEIRSGLMLASLALLDKTDRASHARMFMINHLLGHTHA